MAKVGSDLINQLRPGKGSTIHPNFVRAVLEQSPHIRNRPNTPAYCERDEDVLSGVADEVERCLPVVNRGGDIEKRDLIRSLLPVAGGKLDGVTSVDEVEKIDSLDDTAVVDIKAGNDPDRE